MIKVLFFVHGAISISILQYECSMTVAKGSMIFRFFYDTCVVSVLI